MGFIACGSPLLVTTITHHHSYVAGQPDAISRDAKQGLKLFIGKAGCVRCHNGPLLSDDDFRVIGLKIDTTLSPHADATEKGRAANQALICDPTVADGDFNVNGHFSDDPTTTRNGNFCQQTIPVGVWRSKGLRQVAETALYFRDGQAATLDDVINFMIVAAILKELFWADQNKSSRCIC